MRSRRLPLLAALVVPAAVALLPGPPVARAQAPLPAGFAVFPPSSECLACHNGLVSPAGEDVSIGTAWRGSMMAQSARDPYWQAAVRRETIDHPTAARAIEDECSVCHMPMARTLARFAGGSGRIFAHLPVGAGDSEEDRLAADGVSCSACHQIRADRLGDSASFTGGYVVADPAAPRPRPIYGRRAVTSGLAAIMRSATGFAPAESRHVRESEMCATCHTLITHALGPDGEVVGELPEQVPYLEWRHSAYRGERGCQSCHMKAVEEATPIASVLGEPREGLARHAFVGGNAFMLRLLNRHRDLLGVEAFPHELEATAAATEQQLRSETASLRIERAEAAPGRLEVDVAVVNRTGHKLPTGYPSRRAWVHLLVRDAAGRTVFESGALEPGGRIAGNDNDADPRAFEPHHAEITSPGEVQVYEAIMADHAGAVTTGLLRGVRYLKDNRLLPRGFDKATAGAEVRVRGAAAADPDFAGGGDLVRYAVSTGNAPGPFRVEAELRYQTIAARWAENFRPYEAEETRRFVSLHEAMADSSAATLARDAAVAR
jgi:cytochrome c551/c552